MPEIQVTPLSSDLAFGARIGGVDAAALEDPAVRAHIRDLFEDRGVLVFAGMEPTSAMQVALSEVFGPLQDHPFRGMTLVDKDKPGLIEFDFDPSDADVYEVEGRQLINFLPWHFDACYAKELNRGAVLRSVVIPPEGGLTGFADGIQLYQAIDRDLRAKFEDAEIVYQAALMQMNQRFGILRNYRVIRSKESTLKAIRMNAEAPRSVHPAIWRRATGEQVLHVSPWQAAGIYGREDAEGHALLEALCDEMYAKMTPYWHKWEPTDMVVWDNWRFLHGVSGQDPQYPRRVHRTTIKGDYGLGRFEHDAETGAGILATE